VTLAPVRASDVQALPARHDDSPHPAAFGGSPPPPGEGDGEAVLAAVAEPAHAIATPVDDRMIVPRLQSAVARVLPAIEATLAKLGAAPMPPREMEQAARALSSLTRTLRELNGLLEQHKAPADRDDGPEDIDEFRLELARRMNAFVDARIGKADGGPEPQKA
jgi:hypothetical protein